MNFLEIAKSCGASDFIGNDDRDLPKVIFTHDQLHAYTEQVCKPMVEALHWIEKNDDSSYYVCEKMAQEALAAHKQMMGDRHE